MIGPLPRRSRIRFRLRAPRFSGLTTLRRSSQSGGGPLKPGCEEGGNCSVQVEGTRDRLVPLRWSDVGRQHKVIVVDEVDKGLVVRLRGDKRRQLLSQLR